MSVIDNFKDVQSAASVAAVAGVMVASAYFQKKITSVEEDLAEIKKNLAAALPHVDPKIKTTMRTDLDQALAAIRTLDSRLANTQKELRKYTGYKDDHGNVRKYVRVTERDPRNSASRSYSSDASSDDDDDLSDDVEAMME